jgi:HK97 family phage major capsid protein
MSEQAQVTAPWENLGLKDLSAWVVDAAEKQQAYFKSNEGRWDNDRLTIFRERNKELEAATARKAQLAETQLMYDRAAEVSKSMKEPVEHPPFQGNNGSGKTAEQPSRAFKSFGEMFTESQAYKSVGSHSNGIVNPYGVEIKEFDFSDAVKTLMTTAAGYSAPNDRTSIVVPYAQRTPRLGDLIPSDPTTLSQIKYMEETTALAGTNAQVAIAEGVAKFENTLAFTERTAQVEKVGTFLHVTTEQLDDIPGIQGIINNRLLTFLQLKEEDLLLNGTGVTPQIEGFLTKVIGTQARGTDSNIDAIFKAIQKIRTTGFAEPDAIVMHPDNFTPIALYKDTAGNYSFNVLTEDAGVMRLFGKVLILTPAITANTSLVGSFRLFSHISRRMGMTVQVGMNGDDFKENKRTVLAEFREALEVYRLLAFCKVTSLQ